MGVGGCEHLGCFALGAALTPPVVSPFLLSGPGESTALAVRLCTWALLLCHPPQPGFILHQRFRHRGAKAVQRPSASSQMWAVPRHGQVPAVWRPSGLVSPRKWPLLRHQVPVSLPPCDQRCLCLGPLDPAWGWTSCPRQRHLSSPEGLWAVQNSSHCGRGQGTQTLLFSTGETHMTHIISVFFRDGAPESSSPDVGARAGRDSCFPACAGEVGWAVLAGPCCGCKAASPSCWPFSVQGPGFKEAPCTLCHMDLHCVPQMSSRKEKGSFR